MWGETPTILLEGAQKMLKKLFAVALISIMVPLTGCSKDDGGEETKTAEGQAPAAQQEEPDFIAVQHILIGFQGSVPGKPITRSQEEAAELAADVFKRAKDGEDFDKLVAEFTDDAAPGIYKMANFNAEADMSQRVFPRAQMVKAFGDIGFPLDVGGINMAVYDPVNSQYGWHIIKRVE